MPDIFRIVVYPVPASATAAFDAFLGGERLCRSEMPYLAAARVLAGRGVAKDAVLQMWHPGSQTWALSGLVWAAARLRVADSDDGKPRFRKWMPYTGPRRRVAA